MLDFSLENELFGQGYRTIGALDEAGRGPLAGPVVAACVVVEEGRKISDPLFEAVNDSKKLSEKKRERLHDEILGEFSGVGIGLCDHLTIDRINILQASFLAMKKAIGGQKLKPDFIILDGGFLIPNLSLMQRNVVKGDSTVWSIAAASIVAKVTRDRIMLKMHELYPQYGFDRHKGYGTRLHFEKLAAYGPSPIHRLSFAPVEQLIKRPK